MSIHNTPKDRRRKSRNLVLAAFILLILLWIFKLSYPQYTIIPAFPSGNLTLTPSSLPQSSILKRSSRNQRRKVQIEAYRLQSHHPRIRRLQRNSWYQSSRHNRNALPHQPHPPHSPLQHRPRSQLAHPNLHLRRIRHAILRIRSPKPLPQNQPHPNPDPPPNRPLHKLRFCKCIHDEELVMGEFGSGGTCAVVSE
jgi:hypothetical protein